MTWDNPGYGTHLPALVWAVTNCAGPVLEIGAGEWSTPMLHQLCHDRYVVTVENNPAWALRFESMATQGHVFVSYVDAAISAGEWGVVLIDNDPETDRLQHFDLLADYFVVHDAQLEGGDRAAREAMLERIHSFPEVRFYTDQNPHTAICSRTHEL